MIEGLIITFRETLEIALIVGIILGYLNKTKQTRYNNVVYLGIIFGIFASIITALLFIVIVGEFSGIAEQIFEGTTMIIGAILLTTMILWMMRQKHVTQEMHKNIDKQINKNNNLSLFLLVFIAVLREGVETVIFLGAASFVSTENNLLGGIIGIFLAIIIGFLLFVSSMKINLKKFFLITNILLILFAAGLVAHGVHEFEEAGIIPVVVENVWDINPSVNTDGTYPLLHEKGQIGSIFRGLFGYTGSPSLMELLAYLTYILIVILTWANIEKVHKII